MFGKFIIRKHFWNSPIRQMPCCTQLVAQLNYICIDIGHWEKYYWEKYYWEKYYWEKYYWEKFYWEKYYWEKYSAQPFIDVIP